MSIEAKKIEIIEAVLQMQDENALTFIIDNIHSFHDTTKTPDSLLSLAGSLTEEEAEEMKQIIEDHFEKIDPNDWK